MKKTHLVLSSFALLVILCSCNQSTPSSNSLASNTPLISEDPIIKVNRLEAYNDSFNLQTTIQTIENEKVISSYYESYLDEDYYTFIGYSEDKSFVTRTLYFEKGQENEVIRKEINALNQIISTKQKDSLWSTSIYANPLSRFHLFIEEENKKYSIENVATQNILNFNALISGQLTGSLVPIESYFQLENEQLHYTSKYENNGIQLILSSKFVKKENEVVKKIQPFLENEDSKKFDAIFERLKNQNYTVEIKSSKEEIIETIFVNSSQIYSRFKNDNKGYLKTNDGYITLAINDNETQVHLNSESTDSFTSLHANFNLSGAILRKDHSDFVVSSGVNQVLNAFSLVHAKDYLSNNLLKFNCTSDELSIMTKNLNSETYVLTFKNIGQTILPVDLSNYNAKNSWEDENPALAAALQSLFNDFNVLPYFDTGYGWNYFDYDENYSTIEIFSEDVPEFDCPNMKMTYAELLANQGYKKLTQEEIETLDWVNAETNQQIYDLGNGFACEVYDGYNDSYMSGLVLYIQPFNA